MKLSYDQIKALINAANRGHFAGRLIALRDSGLIAMWKKEFGEHAKAK